MQAQGAAREARMNVYGQRWAPWGWAAVLSLVLWAGIIWLAFQLVGCATMLEAEGGGSITRKETVSVHKDGKSPDLACVKGESMTCCCDLSREGIFTCRCPHPGGVQ